MKKALITKITFSLFCTISLSPIGMAAENAGIDLQKAIAISIESTGGGKALEAKSEHEDGKMLFEVEVLKEGKVTEVSVDATTGKVVESSTENFISKFLNFGENKKRDVIANAKITLEEAIEIALKDQNGIVTEAETKFKNDTDFFEVTVLSETKEVELQISPVDGKIIKKKIEKDDDGDKDHDDND